MGSDIAVVAKWKVLAIVLLATLAVSLGEAILAKGMKQSGTDQSGAIAQIRAVLNLPVIIGTLLMIVYFGLYMFALKLADLSFVLPITGLSYLIGAFMAKWYLHETVTPTRWCGALFITLGVVVVGLGEKAGGP